MKALIRYVLNRLPYIGRLRKYFVEAGEWPPGHFHSPIPGREEVLRYVQSAPLQRQARYSDVGEDKISLLDIQLNRQGQLDLLREFSRYYSEIPFSEQKSQGCRYFYDQQCFHHADAVFHYSFLAHIKPKRIIEVGCGYSSAVILDAIDRAFDHRPQVTFIEPYPERLRSIFQPSDEGQVCLLEKKVQDVPLETFSALQADDLLSIDSTHIMKVGSDLQFLIFEVLPRMPIGVYVHFHDVFWPFEYPAEWLERGWYWNEDYFLRAFLAYNRAWSICFFNAYVATAFRAFIAENMPLCVKHNGSSLYIRRIA